MRREGREGEGRGGRRVGRGEREGRREKRGEGRREGREEKGGEVDKLTSHHDTPLNTTPYIGVPSWRAHTQWVH